MLSLMPSCLPNPPLPGTRRGFPGIPQSAFPREMLEPGHRREKGGERGGLVGRMGGGASDGRYRGKLV